MTLTHRDTEFAVKTILDAIGSQVGQHGCPRLRPVGKPGAWRGIAAPKGLPKEIATQYETAIKKIWDSAEFKEFMNRRGFDMIYLDSAGFAEFMKADNEDNGKALKSLGLAK